MRVLRVCLRAGAIAVAIAALTIPWTGSVSAQASTAPVQAKKYKATRPLVLDKQTGQVRMPTQQEVDETVATLLTLTKQQSDGLPQSTAPNGAVTVDLDGNFGGVLLVRPNADGSWETRCVFTFDEGVDFLGLVPDEQR